MDSSLPSVVNSPKPPGLWQELREAVMPRRRRSLRSTPSGRLIKAMAAVFPILNWGRGYEWRMLRSDFMAGLTLASLAIPQSIGYAGLAKMDPQYGLYTSVVPPLIYATMGSSKEIAIGPVAVVSLLLSSMIQKIVDPLEDPSSYRKLVFTSTFFAGLFQAAFGLFRLGFLVDFLSHATLVGFMGGAAIIIGLQQLKGLLGLSHFTNKTDVVSVLSAVWSAINEPWQPGNFLIGCSFLIFILSSRFIGRKKRKLFWLPAIAPLVSVIISTLAVKLSRADLHGVKIIKNVEAGLNPSSVKQLQFEGPLVVEAAKVGLISAIIALTEAIAVGRSFASINGYQLDGNKEMLAMGCMNIAGSMSSCYVATGSFSRTAVNFSSGCKTAMSNIVMALTVILSLELLMKLLYFTPTAILASIILASLPSLVDVQEAFRIWKVDKVDFLACVGAFFGVLFKSVEIGLITAVFISLLKILLGSLWARIDELGKIKETSIFCDIKRFPMAVRTPKMLVLRVDSPFICFANSSSICQKILSWVKEDRETTEENPEDRARGVVLDMSSVMNIDTTGLIVLEELHKQLQSDGLQMAVANPGWRLIHKMRMAKLSSKIGEEMFFLTVAEAVEACLGLSKNAAPRQ